MNAETLLGGYTEEVLKAVFDEVVSFSQVNDWKLPLSYVIVDNDDDKTIDCINMVRFAIEFYCGGKCETHVLKGNTGDLWVITHKGYYHFIGA